MKTPLVPIEVMGRFPSQGQGAVLFSGRIGQEPWVLKVPDPEKPVVSRSLSVRELIYGRFAERLALPVAPLKVVKVTTGSRSLVNVRTSQEAFTATLQLDLRSCVQTWAELRPHDRAALVFWENATAIGTGDKLRSKWPRDFFRCAPFRNGGSPYAMLDYESVENLWDIASSGGAVSEELPLCTDSLACVHGLPRALLADAKEEALACLERDTWDYLVRDAGTFHTGDLEPLRMAMRTRIEGAWRGLARDAGAGT